MDEHGGKAMSLLEHLSELRQCLIRSFAAVLVCFILAMIFSRELIEFLKGPLRSALPAAEEVLHFTGPLDVFLTSIRVSLLSAVIVSSPVWIWQFWKFIEPALYEHEKKLVLPFIFASTSLFISGIAFCFWVIFPLALEFLIQLGQEVGVPMITITDYVSMLTLMILGFGLVFETPVILVLLAVLDLVSAEGLAKYRRYVIVGTLFVGAVLTPPDPMSQIGMALPLYVMYELSILVIRMIRKSPSKKTSDV